MLKHSHVFGELLAPLHRKIIEFLHPHGECAVYSVQFYTSEWCGYERSVQFNTLDQASAYFEQFACIEDTEYFEVNLEVFRTEQQIRDKVGDDSLECVTRERDSEG